jgi:hypothetical protein
MRRIAWGSLNSRQLGKYAEYFVKMELTMHGLDIYTSEVDDKGIDFVARKGMNKYLDVQVKSVYKAKYIYFPKSKFEINRANLLVAVVLFVAGEVPDIYLIPAQAWKTPNSLFVSRDFSGEGKKSAPEWGIQLSKKSMPLLATYALELIVGTL